MVGWAEETTLDVEYAHSIAPGAKIVLAETAVDETEGVQGLPEMMNAEKSLIDAGVPDVISQSFGATENTFPGFDQGNFTSLTDLRYAFKDAAAHGVTVLASSGDNGATSRRPTGGFYPTAANSWPSADPLVLSIGGSIPLIDDNGNRLAPDVVGNDNDLGEPGGVSGGATPTSSRARSTRTRSRTSSVPPRHARHLDERRPRRRGLGVLQLPAHAGSAGTSSPAPASRARCSRASSRWPTWPATGSATSTTPCTPWASFAAPALPEHHRHPGHHVRQHHGQRCHRPDAGPGYDMASGWGTIDGAKFVPALARFR